MKRYLSYFHPLMPVYLAYMLQQVEYNPGKFITWIKRLPDLTKVMHRQKIVWTAKALLLTFIIYIFFLFYVLLAIAEIFISPYSAILTLVVTPFFVVLLTYIIVWAAWNYIEAPVRDKKIADAAKIFAELRGVKIAIAGSYGKTSMKELLLTVLSEKKKVAATPGNKNVPISHAAWSKKLDDNEDVLLIEYGEGAPGDIKKLANLSTPDYAVITGLAPNHLDEYKNLNAVADDLLSLKNHVKPEKIFINQTSFSNFDLSGLSVYSNKEILDWKIKGVKVDYSGTSFVMEKGKKSIKLKSGLIGRHHVGPIAVAVVLAQKLGISNADIEKGVAKTHPFEHRMQPRHINGAWIIDDTYNGSLEGIRAGLELLKDLPAKRKIYVTPGLVDQGEETERVHLEIGGLIAAAKPDKVVLMKNSVTDTIQKGLKKAKYQGEIQIETNPLEYYTNLEHILAGGDLVMLQNDWTDNYS